MDRAALLKEFGFEKEEEIESVKGHYVKTGFPTPKRRYHLWWEVFDLSLEEPYFWVLESLREYLPYVEKLEDSFAASENSAFFGVTQQRLGAQQDKVSQFLATTGKMIKELFQMVRELRIVDERLEYYKEAGAEVDKPIAQRHKGAEITLKGLFVDLVQGGGKSAASVYGMARELEFITLPDLFFDAPPFKDVAELEKFVNDLAKNFNQNVLRVLVRHLRQFMEWKQRTEQEHLNRRRFMLQYLLQHFEIIKMYIDWIKPYLRHVARLHLKESNMTAPDLISAFEGSMLDVELLAWQRKQVGEEGANSCIIATFNFRTRPEMKVVQEGYQRGPVHIGKFEMQLRLYEWTDTQKENYKKFKQKEALMLMGDISASVQQAMQSLGEELDRYLDEARGTKPKAEEKKAGHDAGHGSKSVVQKFFGDFYNSGKPSAKKQKPMSKKEMYAHKEKMEAAYKNMYKNTNYTMWYCYNNFKKAHAMVAW